MDGAKQALVLGSELRDLTVKVSGRSGKSGRSKMLGASLLSSSASCTVAIARIFSA